MDPGDVIAAFERMALAEKDELRIDDAIAGLSSLMADEQMPDEVWQALLTVGATLYHIALTQRLGIIGAPDTPVNPA